MKSYHAHRFSAAIRGALTLLGLETIGSTRYIEVLKPTASTVDPRALEGVASGLVVVCSLWSRIHEATGGAGVPREPGPAVPPKEGLLEELERR